MKISRMLTAFLKILDSFSGRSDFRPIMNPVSLLPTAPDAGLYLIQTDASLQRELVLRQMADQLSHWPSRPYQHF